MPCCRTALFSSELHRMRSKWHHETKRQNICRSKIRSSVNSWAYRSFPTYYPILRMRRGLASRSHSSGRGSHSTRTRSSMSTQVIQSGTSSPRNLTVYQVLRSLDLRLPLSIREQYYRQMRVQHLLNLVIPELCHRCHRILTSQSLDFDHRAAGATPALLCFFPVRDRSDPPPFPLPS